MGKTSRTLNPALHMREVAKALKSKMRCRERVNQIEELSTQGPRQGGGALVLAHVLFRMVK